MLFQTMRKPEDHLLISGKQIYPTGSNNLLRLACNSWIEPIEICKFSKVNTSMETTSEAKPSDSIILVPEGDRSVSTESLTNEDVSRLVDIFPGACKFEYGNGENSVFYGRCKRCSDRLKPICQITHQFLSALHNRPVINLAKLNPILYATIPNLYLIRQLRRTLVLLWDQIIRCDGKTAEKLCECMDGRMYMLQNINDIDIYSIEDLILVQSSKLEELLKNTIQDVALAHVRTCKACRRRALICDFCGDLNKPIWTHEFTTYKRCINPGCSNVMHIDCLLMMVTDLLSKVDCCFQRQSTTIPLKDYSQLKFSDIQCRTCKEYCTLFSRNNQTIGHYADPFCLPKIDS
uniref:Pleckstrin homology domain-containing family M member 1 n=1 Tax=Schistosoma haematobium TaxID=6185 RepID=A0A094ZCG0_SCHHA